MADLNLKRSCLTPLDEKSVAGEIPKKERKKEIAPRIEATSNPWLSFRMKWDFFIETKMEHSKMKYK